jgi:class 3 adenylate cyclase/CHASE2 domain-containing sensor protein
MFKLSKESKITFIGLLAVPLLWIVLNHFGFLDFLEYKSVDLRFKVRGDVSHQEEPLADERVAVEGNKTVPRVPKVMYVNFDSDTLSMDEVGERPWNRGFFRDVGKILLEEGKARVVGYDFIFSPKSTSSMVPERNVFVSDSAIAELVGKYPNQVVLGSAFTNVQTPFLKNEFVNFLAGPPNLNEGYDPTKMGFRYPESPTYPIFTYGNGKYLGINAPITVAPNKVDGMQRIVPLWFPGGGKAHAYNVLGGKMAKLGLEGIDLNQSRSPTLVEDGDRLKLIWKDSNNTLVDSQPNSMPLVRDRSFFHFGVEALMAYYGVDEKSVEIAEGNKNLVIRSLEGETLVDASMIEEQGMEINWFSNWKDEAEAEKLYSEAKEFFNQENFAEYVSRGPRIIRLLLERIEVVDFDDEIPVHPELVRVLKNLRLEEKHLRTAGDMIKAAEGKIAAEKAPDIVDLEKLLSKISDNYIPPTLFSEFNPMCGIDDVLNYKTYLEGKNAQAQNADAVVLKMKGALVGFRNLHYQYSEHNESRDLWAKIKEMNSTPTKEQAILLDELAAIERSSEIFKGFTAELRTNEDADLLASDLGDLNQKLRELSVARDLKSKIEKLKNLEEQKLALENEVNELKKRVEQFPALSAVIQKSQIEPKEKDLEALVKEIAKLDGVSKTRLEEQKLALENEVNELKKRVEQFPALSAVIQKSQIEPKEKDLEALVKEIAKLDEISKGSSKDEFSSQELLQSSADAISKTKALLAFNQTKIKEAEIERNQYLSFFKQFEDAIVLVGPTEATFQDLSPTPMDKDPVPKVSVHGNVIKTLSSGLYLTRTLDGKLSSALLILSVCLVVGYLAVNSAPWSNWLGAIVLVLFVALAFFLFSNNHTIIPLAVPVTAGASTFFLGLIVMMVVEQKAKGRLKGMFGSYVSAELVDQMVNSGEEPHLGGEETAITAFFSDVQAFSSFSELLTPTGLVDLMNEYLTAMTDILQEERGTLDKYIGDAIVAMYGAPIPMEDHAYQSVRTALRMQEKQLDLREKWAKEEEKWGNCYGLVKQMQTRIGCNTGTATVGNMGALDRFNYTMMGDMVNLAARCESGAKAYGAYIMITEETKLASEKTKDDIAFRYLDKIVVKGRSQPVSMYEPTGFMADLKQETQDCLDCFKQGIDKYLLQDWDGALGMFEKAKELEPNKPGVSPGVKDNPSMILIDRCKVMKENPPSDDWDGVYVMTSK